MDTNENSVIDDIYYAFLKKRNELNRLVKKNQEEIQETEALLKSLMETDVDMKYFLRVIRRIFIKMKFHLQKIRSNI